MWTAGRTAKKIFKQPAAFALAVVKQFRANQGVLLAGAVDGDVGRGMDDGRTSQIVEDVAGGVPDRHRGRSDEVRAQGARARGVGTRGWMSQSMAPLYWLLKAQTR